MTEYGAGGPYAHCGVCLEFRATEVAEFLGMIGTAAQENHLPLEAIKIRIVELRDPPNLRMGWYLNTEERHGSAEFVRDIAYTPEAKNSLER